MNLKERLDVEIQIESKCSFSERIKATLEGTEGNCSFLSTEFIVGLSGLFLPYILGFIVISVFCLTLVDISLDTYFKVLADNFSLVGLWSIGYFLISLLIMLYGSYYYAVKR